MKTKIFENINKYLIPFDTKNAYNIGKIIIDTTAINVSTIRMNDKASETSFLSTDFEITDLM
jgi:hypothetical protein